MKVFFEKTILPCVLDDVIAWHIQHGYVWNVKSEDGKFLGVFYATLLNGDGTVIHFSTVPGVRISAAQQLAAYKKGVRILQPMGVVFATIPAEKQKLIRITKHLGFSETDGNFYRPGTGEIVLLKLLDAQNAILEPTKQEKEVTCREVR